MNSFAQLGQQLLQLWGAMSPARRVGMVAVLALAMAAVLGIGYWAAQPDYRLLFADLSAEDAGIIASKLQGKNIPFRLEAGGTAILVPAESMASGQKWFL